jgi:glyoxylase-like metal-dependent hydrolase (beta-lactamase superfamily II)
MSATIPAGSGPLGRVELLEDGVAQFHGFCNVGLVWGRGEALVVDTSNARLGARAVAGLREQTRDPVALVVYTHGHVDHVGGAPAFLSDAEQRGHPRPVFWAHEDLPARFARYKATWGWNNEVNRRQFQLPPGVDAFPRDSSTGGSDQPCREPARVERTTLRRTDDATGSGSRAPAPLSAISRTDPTRNPSSRRTR